MEGGEANYREDGKGGAAFVNDTGELKVHDGRAVRRLLHH